MKSNPANSAATQVKQNRRKLEGWSVIFKCLLCVKGTEAKATIANTNLLVTLKRRDTKKCIICFLPCCPKRLKKKTRLYTGYRVIGDFSMHYFHRSINNYFSYLEWLFLHLLAVSLLPLIIPSNRLLSLSVTHL